MKTNETKMTVSELREALKASRAKVRLHFTAKGNPAWKCFYRYGKNDREIGTYRLTKKEANEYLAEFGLTANLVVEIEKAIDEAQAAKTAAMKESGELYTGGRDCHKLTNDEINTVYAKFATADAETEKEQTEMKTNEIKIETRISANGAANVYVNGKRTSNEKAVEIAEANGLPTYRAVCYTYSQSNNSIDETLATALSAYKWLCAKGRQNINVADGSWEIERLTDHKVIYEIDERDEKINADDEPEFANFIYAKSGAEYIKNRYDRMINYFNQLVKDGLTEEQAEQVITVFAENTGARKHCELIKEFKAANGIVEESPAEEARRAAERAGVDTKGEFGITVIGNNGVKVNVRPDCKIVAVHNELFVATNFLGIYDTSAEAEQAAKDLKAAIQNGAGEYHINAYEVDAKIELAADTVAEISTNVDNCGFTDEDFLSELTVTLDINAAVEKILATADNFRYLAQRHEITLTKPDSEVIWQSDFRGYKDGKTFLVTEIYNHPDGTLREVLVRKNELSALPVITVQIGDLTPDDAKAEPAQAYDESAFELLPTVDELNDADTGLPLADGEVEYMGDAQAILVVTFINDIKESKRFETANAAIAFARECEKNSLIKRGYVMGDDKHYGNEVIYEFNKRTQAILNDERNQLIRQRENLNSRLRNGLLTVDEFNADAGEVDAAIRYVKLQIAALKAGDTFDYADAAEHLKTVYGNVTGCISEWKFEHGLSLEQCEQIYVAAHIDRNFDTDVDRELINRMIDEFKCANAENFYRETEKFYRETESTFREMKSAVAPARKFLREHIFDIYHFDYVLTIFNQRGELKASPNKFHLVDTRFDVEVDRCELDYVIYFGNAELARYRTVENVNRAVDQFAIAIANRRFEFTFPEDAIDPIEQLARGIERMRELGELDSTIDSANEKARIC